jgi:hypothetical protein
MTGTHRYMSRHDCGLATYAAGKALLRSTILGGACLQLEEDKQWHASSTCSHVLIGACVYSSKWGQASHRSPVCIQQPMDKQ